MFRDFLKGISLRGFIISIFYHVDCILALKFLLVKIN